MFKLGMMVVACVLVAVAVYLVGSQAMSSADLNKALNTSTIFGR